jgi:hypothetical protein
LFFHFVFCYSHHGYIQWLFPLREEGLNFRAQKLQRHEIETITKSQQMMKRVRRSYQVKTNANKYDKFRSRW